MVLVLFCAFSGNKKKIPLVSVKSKNTIKYVKKFYLRVIRKKKQNKRDEVKYTEAGLCESASSIIHHPSFSESHWEAFFLARNRKKGYQIPKVYGTQNKSGKLLTNHTHSTSQSFPMVGCVW